MAKFLNTSATNYYLEELIKNASDRLILISPFLKLNDRIKELLEDKNRLKIDVRIVYGKSELQPGEINWLKELTFIRTSFCKNLHAKCYINEEAQRIIRISDEIRISLEKIVAESEDSTSNDEIGAKLSSSKIAKKHGLKTPDLLSKLSALGYLESNGDNYTLTSKGNDIGGEAKSSKRFGDYFIWPEDVNIES